MHTYKSHQSNFKMSLLAHEGELHLLHSLGGMAMPKELDQTVGRGGSNPHAVPVWAEIQSERLAAFRRFLHGMAS